MSSVHTVVLNSLQWRKDLDSNTVNTVCIAHYAHYVASKLFSQSGGLHIKHYYDLVEVCYTSQRITQEIR